MPDTNTYNANALGIIFFHCQTLMLNVFFLTVRHKLLIHLIPLTFE